MVPVSVLLCSDPIQRDVATFSAIVDRPGTVVLNQDIDPDGSGSVRTTIVDSTGTISIETASAEYTCIGCALRENGLPTLALLAGSSQWSQILWALPVAATGDAAVSALDARGRELGLRLATTASVVDLDALDRDLLDDDLLAERGLQLSDDDRRSVGEVVAAQLCSVDLVVRSGASSVGRQLVDHLLGSLAVSADLDAGVDLFAQRHHPRVSTARTDPSRLCRTQAPDDEGGVWSLDLSDPRPFDPQRLLSLLDELAGSRLYSRGRFTLTSRPGDLHVWDGAGGQVSIGTAQRGNATTGTRFVWTGVGDADRRSAVASAFEESLAAPTIGRSDRIDSGDDLEPWLGSYRSSA